jgi:hypothetical protein
MLLQEVHCLNSPFTMKFVKFGINVTCQMREDVWSSELVTIVTTPHVSESSIGSCFTLLCVDYNNPKWKFFSCIFDSIIGRMTLISKK